MNTEQYAELIEAMRHSVATRYGVPPVELRPPATPERVAAAGERLGVAIPEDVAALLQAADGGSLFGQGIQFAPVHPYNENSDPNQIALVTATEAIRGFVSQPDRLGGEIEYVPRPDFISLTTGGQHGLCYEVSGPNAGSILYFSVLDIEWHIARVAPSLQNVFLAARECVDIYPEFIITDTNEHVFRKYGIDTRLNG
ncbi:MAG: SMI1/KNR4 family protein [Acidimicrobiales bacterium]